MSITCLHPLDWFCPTVCLHTSNIPGNSPTGELGDALENDMVKSVTFFTDLGGTWQ